MKYYLVKLYRTQTGNRSAYATPEGRRAPTFLPRFAAKFNSDIAANRHKDLCRCKNYPEPKVVVVEVDDGIIEDNTPTEAELELQVARRWDPDAS